MGKQRVVVGEEDGNKMTGDHHWGRVVVPHVFRLVSLYLGQRDVCALLCVSASCHRQLAAHAPVCKVLDLQGRNTAGERLVAALSLLRYQNVEEINLEFAQGLQDEHLSAVKFESLQRLNLNACQKITDSGVKAVASANPHLKLFSIYWNLKVTDVAIESVVMSCKHLTALNVSGCKNITDASLQNIAKFSPGIKSLNLTRCVKLTDNGLLCLTDSCQSLEELYLYAIPGFTVRAFREFSHFRKLQLLDLCGAQNLTDEGLAPIALCKALVSLNLTWCVQITDIGLKALAQHCSLLQLLSLHGILGVSDEGLKSLSECCRNSLVTIDVHGCVKIKHQSKSDLLQLFPNLSTFQVHS
ncbi:unnamed protein product [Sphagnum tenellum]